MAAERADDRARLGRLGEDIAVRHLEAQGLEILDRNWRCARGDLRGELDIVARDGRVLVVGEVKTRRRGPAGGPLDAVDVRKLRRLRRLGAAWLAERGLAAAEVRFDLLAVSWPAPGGAAAVVHVRGVAP